MTASNLITWNRFASLPAVVAEREVTAPILANALASKRNRENGVHVPLSAADHADLTCAMLRGYAALVDVPVAAGVSGE